MPQIYDWIELNLKPEINKGIADTSVQSMISAGRPFTSDVLKLSQVGNKPLEPEITLMLPTHNFFYLRFPLNIKPNDKHTINLISLDIELQSQGEDAICWSMDPMRIEREKKLTAEAGISSKLKLELFELGGETKAGEEYIEYTSQVEAFGLGESHPAWELKSLDNKKLSGVQLFHMVVQVGKNIPFTVIVRMRVEIFKEGLLWSYRVTKKDNSLELFKISF